MRLSQASRVQMVWMDEARQGQRVQDELPVPSWDVGVDRLVGCEAGESCWIVDRKGGHWPKPQASLKGKYGGWTSLVH